MQLPLNVTKNAAGTTAATGAEGKAAGAKESDGEAGGAFTAMMRLMANGGSGKGSKDAGAGTETPGDVDGQETAQGAATSALARLLGMKGGTEEPGDADGKPDVGTADGEADSAQASGEQAAGAAMVATSAVGALASRIAGAVQAKTGGQGAQAGQQMPGQSAQGAGATAASGNADGDGEVDTLFSRFAVKPETVSMREGKGDATSSPRVTADSIDVVRQETHFAPSMRIPPIQQVGTAISQALGGNQGAVPQGLGLADPAATLGQTSGPTVKILEIKLQPEELGTVRVTMRIVDDTLQVDVRSANQQTAEMLQKDKHMLDRMLQSAGYKADSVTVHGMGDDRSAFQVTSTPGAQNAGQQASWQGGARGEGAPGGDAGNGDGGNGAGGQSPQDHSGKNGEGAHGPEDISRDRRADGSALYL